MPDPFESETARQLIDAMASGSACARERFFVAFLPRIRVTVSVLTRHLPDLRAQIDDLVHDVVVRLLQHNCRALRRWRGDASLGTYLHVIAHNLITDRLRAATRGAPAPVAPDDAPEQQVDPRPDSDPLAEAERTQLRVHVERCLENLEPRDRELLAGFYVHGRSYAELARDASCTVNATGVALHRARQRFCREFNARVPGVLTAGTPDTWREEW